MPSRGDSATTRPISGRRLAELGVVAGALLVIVSAGIVGIAAFDTASGRISAQTSTRSNLFSAGRIDLEVGGAEELLFDADGLYPGVSVERCLTLSYRGTIDDAGIRLSARRDGGDGLDAFLETTISIGEGSDPECSDHRPSSTRFVGTLDDLWDAHPDYERGVRIENEADEGFETTVRLAVTVLDDQRAQGRSTDFWIVLEARP